MFILLAVNVLDIPSGISILIIAQNAPLFKLSNSIYTFHERIAHFISISGIIYKPLRSGMQIEAAFVISRL